MRERYSLKILFLRIGMVTGRSARMNAVAQQLVLGLLRRSDLSDEWIQRYHNVLDSDSPNRLHLAVFIDPYLGWILDGSKTVESRFSVVRCAPWNAVENGDVVLMKQLSGPVVGAFAIGYVSSYEIGEGDLELIRELFGEAIRPEEDDFWNQRTGARYATLMSIADHHEVNATRIPKRDRRGWVVLDPTCAQGSLIDGF